MTDKPWFGYRSPGYGSVLKTPAGWMFAVLFAAFFAFVTVGYLSGRMSPAGSLALAVGGALVGAIIIWNKSASRSPIRGSGQSS